MRHNTYTSGYDLWKKSKMSESTIRLEVAIPLEDLESIYALWPKALMMGLRFKDGTDVTLEVSDKEDAGALIEYLKGAIAMRQHWSRGRSLRKRC